MILKTERKKLKRVLKNRYIKDVSDILTKKDITTETGAQYSAAYISNVLNGRESNENIELALFELYEKRLSQQSKMKAKRQRILQKQNPTR